MDLPQPDSKKGAPGWVVTFGDMMSLLLTFFIMLLSFSSTDPAIYKQVAGSMKDAFGVQKRDKNMEIPRADSILATHFDPALERDSSLLELVSQVLAQELEAVDAGLTPWGLDRAENEDSEQGRAEGPESDAGSVSVEQRGDGSVLVRVSDGLLFKSGEAALSPASFELLDRLAGLIRLRSLEVLVEGHTDSVPIATARFPSNWELSGGRAAAVIRALIQRGVRPESLTALALAETRPLASNATDEGRRLNRRVQFLLRQPAAETARNEEPGPAP
jgi:chemotaxis protein MotB